MRKGCMNKENSLRISISQLQRPSRRYRRYLLVAFRNRMPSGSENEILIKLNPDRICQSLRFRFLCPPSSPAYTPTTPLCNGAQPTPHQAMLSPTQHIQSFPFTNISPLHSILARNHIPPPPPWLPLQHHTRHPITPITCRIRLSPTTCKTYMGRSQTSQWRTRLETDEPRQQTKRTDKGGPWGTGADTEWEEGKECCGDGVRGGAGGQGARG